MFLRLQAAADEENEVGSNKAVIISPYIRHVRPDPNGDFGEKDNFFKSWPAIKNRNSCKLYAAEERINNVDLNWSLEAFKNLSDFGYIHICTHGFPFRNGILSGWKDEWGTTIAVGWGDVALYSGVLLPKKADGSYDITGFEDDLKEKRIAIYTNGTVAILSSFIEHYVKNLPNSIVFLSACYSTYNNEHSGCISGERSGAVIGYNMAASIKYSGEMGRVIPEELYKGKTIQEALEEAKKIYADASIEGIRRPAAFGKIKNAGFENGVLAPWSKARRWPGHPSTWERRQPTEGELQTSRIGSYMAIISTGLGYTTD